jgi:hypothetical protein
MNLRRVFATIALCAATVTCPVPAWAQQPPAAAPTRDPARNLDPLQPDFTLSALPTTLRVPRFKSAFRVTHRFGRPLGSGSFGSLASDLFGLDSGAQIGLEYRFGIMKGLQAGIYRTNDRTIEFFTQYSLMEQSASRPVGIGVLAAMDGTNNFRDSYSPALGVIVSRKVGRFAAVYAEPIWVNNSNPLPSALVDDNDSFLLGLGARLRVRRTVYVVGEVVPRVAGYDPRVDHVTAGLSRAGHVAVGLEKVVGGHTFQINFSNGVGTTISQLAQGGGSKDNWYLGFNISRKFWR